MTTRLWTDPRDDARWLVIRRWFRHECFGYSARSTLQLASSSEYWMVQEERSPSPDLTDEYLMALLDRCRGSRDDSGATGA